MLAALLARPAAPGCTTRGMLLAAFREAAAGVPPVALDLGLPSAEARAAALALADLALALRRHGRRPLAAAAPGAPPNAQEIAVLALMTAGAPHRACLLPWLLRPEGQPSGARAAALLAAVTRGEA